MCFSGGWRRAGRGRLEESNTLVSLSFSIFFPSLCAREKASRGRRGGRGAAEAALQGGRARPGRAPAPPPPGHHGEPARSTLKVPGSVTGVLCEPPWQDLSDSPGNGDHGHRCSADSAAKSRGGGAARPETRTARRENGAPQRSFVGHFLPAQPLHSALGGRTLLPETANACGA